MAIFVFLLPLCIFPFVVVFFKFVNRQKGSSSSTPTNWPVVGMLPGLVRNAHRIHDYITELMSENGATFHFKGGLLFPKMDMLVTCDPININHIFNKRFSNYPKGPEFKKIFEILGDSIFRADFELWELHRRATLSVINQAGFYTLVEKTTWQTVRTGLFPVLDHYVLEGTEIDMQNILDRFAFDNTCRLFFNHNPCSLSKDLTNRVRCEKALSEAVEPLLHRHIWPESIWRLQSWLNIGNERTLTEASEAFDEFFHRRIISMEEDNGYYTANNKVNVYAVFKKVYEESCGNNIDFSGDLRRFLKDTFLGLLIAGRDSLSTTLTWFFWLLAENPFAETKILEEIESVLSLSSHENPSFFGVEECKKLVYLHACLSETLRLFPPVALELKSPVEPDILPAGGNNNNNMKVEKNTKIVISFYSTGRMESVWGKDCLEFKPERWILAGGGLRHEPSFRFPAFNVGPRSCPGKEMSFVEMKMLAVAIVHRYRVRLVEGHRVSTRASVILKTKHGLKVKLFPRKDA
ncbi:hypothetical protein ACP275_08G169600 [Erythranthe tilingii]